MIPRIVAGFFSVTLLSIGGWQLPAPAQAADVTLFASWHAAYGEPGARDTLTGACDNVGADTLYLSFDPGDTVRTFYGLIAIVGFHAGSRDTLSERWWLGGGEGNFYNVRVQSGPDSSFHALSPWSPSVTGAMKYRRTSQSGFLRMLYAHSGNEPVRLDPGKRYCFARLIFPHPPPRVPLCDQPMCIELASVRLSVELYKDDERVGTHGPHRCVSLNSPSGAVCAPHRGTAHRIPLWTPWWK